ncbi:MAG: universal stress protein [Pseudomonadota bacterium]
MYTHILVPVAPDHQGRGEAALSAAEALLDDDGRITIIHVNETIPAYVASYVPADVMQKTHDEIRDAMNDLAKRSSAQIDVATITGHPPRAITEYADSHQVDCIVIASHHPGIADYFLGSTASWVVRHADCSVHVVR